MMPTRWPHYSLFAFAAIFGLLFPMVLSSIWRRVRAAAGENASRPAPVPVPRIGEAEPIALRFHLAALLFVGFLGMAMLVLPMVFAIRTEDRIEAALSIAAVAVPFLIALFYCIRRGDLSWGARRSSATDPWRPE